MPQIRNTAARDLEVAGRVYPGRTVVVVGPGEASYLLGNPNFAAVDDAPVSPAPDSKPEPRSRGRNKED